MYRIQEKVFLVLLTTNPVREKSSDCEEMTYDTRVIRGCYYPGTTDRCSDLPRCVRKSDYDYEFGLRKERTRMSYGRIFFLSRRSPRDPKGSHVRL